MSDEQIVKYVKDMVIDNLAKRDFWADAASIGFDETNRELLAHINGLIELFEKAKEILEKESNTNDNH